MLLSNCRLFFAIVVQNSPILTIVFGNSSGVGGSVNGESYPIKAGTWYQLRWCNTFQDIANSEPVFTKHFVQNGFVKQVDGETIY